MLVVARMQVVRASIALYCSAERYTYARTYEKQPKHILARPAPTQSTSVFDFLHGILLKSSSSFVGKHNTPTINMITAAMASIYHPHLHPIESTKNPARNSPAEKPTGCAAPCSAKPKFRRLPSANDPVISATPAGKHRLTARPCNARKTSSCAGVRAKPHARRVPDMSRIPRRYRLRHATTSETAPEGRSAHPETRL